MWKKSRNWMALATVLVVSQLFASLSHAHGTGGEHILILNSFDSHTSPYLMPKSIFKSELQKQLTEPVSFREVNLEANWGDLKDREDMIVELINKFHTDPHIDLVVTMGPPAVDFWLRNRDRITSKPGILAMAGTNRFYPSDLSPGDTAVLTELNFASLIENVLVLLPKTSHIVMVFGASDYARSLSALAKSHLKEYEDRIDFEYTNDSSLGELEERLSSLGENSAVFYGQLNYDVTGHTLEKGSGLTFIYNASPVPVFGALDEQMGMGIVGGRLIDLSGLGVTASAVAKNMLQERQKEVLWSVQDLTAPVYDWRELKRFGIDHTQLPEGSVIKFIQYSFWDQYWGWLLLIASVFALQSLLITLLLLARRSRQKAEYARTILSGKLITAHEDERRRLARELHDDLSQRLARLSIDTSALKADQEKDKLGDHINELQKNIISVSKDIHDMSYQLHPALLDDLGIETALKAEIQQIGQYCQVQLTENIEPIKSHVTPEAALCTFRIAQEALQNACKHADAMQIKLELRQEGGTLELTVSDDGMGFGVKEHKPVIGLGLFSMHERARLIGGVLKLVSSPGQGTTVKASLPSDGVNQ